MKFLAKVAFPDWQSTTIQVSSEDTCHDVKHRAVQKHAGADGYSTAEYELAFEMLPLSDDLVLSTKFVQANATVHLTLQRKMEGSSGSRPVKPELTRRNTLTRLVSGVKELLGTGPVGSQIEEWSSRKERAALLLANPECPGELKKQAEAEAELCRKQLAELISKAGTTIGPTHIAGYLVKLRTVPNVKWQKRFFTFNEGCMNYRDHPESKLKLEVSLRGARVEQTSSYTYFEEQKFGRFVLQVENELFELGALEQQVDHWVSKINANIALVTPIEFEVGEECSAPWSDGNYYPAVIVSFEADKSVNITFPEYGEDWVCQRSELRKVLTEGDEKKKKSLAPMGQREVVKKDSFLRLYKHGKWTSKHFRLLGLGSVQSLQYFKDVTSFKSLGTIPITAATTVECVNGGELYSFHVIEKDQPPYLLCAASESLRTEWLSAIAAIIKASIFGAMSWGLSLLVLYPPEELGNKELEAILDELEKSKEGTREELMARVREVKKAGLPPLDLTWNTVESIVKASGPVREATTPIAGVQKSKEPKEYVKKEGVLMKKGAMNTKLKSRYFKLVGVGNAQSLVYYKKKEDKTPLGTIPICAATTVQLESGLEFTVTPDDKRAYALTATSEKEAKEWAAVIQNIINATTPGAMSWSSALLVLYPPEELAEKELIAILEEGGMTGNENLNKDQLVCKVAIMKTLAEEELPSPKAPVSKPRPALAKDGAQSGSYPPESATPKARPPPKLPDAGDTPKARPPPAKISADVAVRLPADSMPFKFSSPGGPPVGAKLPPKPSPGTTSANQIALPSPLPAPPLRSVPPPALKSAPPPLPRPAPSVPPAPSSLPLAPPKPTPKPSATAPNFEVGEQCFAPWSDGHYYSCTILSMDGEQVEVNFDEYDEQGTTTLAQLSRDKP